MDLLTDLVGEKYIAKQILNDAKDMAIFEKKKNDINSLFIKNKHKFLIFLGSCINSFIDFDHTLITSENHEIYDIISEEQFDEYLTFLKTKCTGKTKTMYDNWIHPLFTNGKKIYKMSYDAIYKEGNIIKKMKIYSIHILFLRNEEYNTDTLFYIPEEFKDYCGFNIKPLGMIL